MVGFSNTVATFCSVLPFSREASTVSYPAMTYFASEPHIKCLLSPLSKKYNNDDNYTPEPFEHVLTGGLQRVFSYIHVCLTFNIREAVKNDLLGGL